MTELTSAQPTRSLSKRKRLVLLTLAGAVFGASATYAALSLIEGSFPISKDPQRLAAMAVGLVYLLMAVLVAFGTLMTRLGSVLLNVADEAELIERRPDLRSSAMMCALIGMILLMLSLTNGSAPGLLDQSVGTALLAIGVVGLAVGSYAMRNMGDELEKALAVESGALAMHLSISLFGGWGVLAYLGHAPWIGPLGLLAGMAAMYLVAIFWMSGRRGLLTS